MIDWILNKFRSKNSEAVEVFEVNRDCVLCIRSYLHDTELKHYELSDFIHLGEEKGFSFTDVSRVIRKCRSELNIHIEYSPYCDELNEKFNEHFLTIDEAIDFATEKIKEKYGSKVNRDDVFCRIKYIKNKV